MALDRFGRRLHYLRISLTDRCNLRCVYCMPEDITFRPTANLMQDDEILFLVRLFAGLGFDKIRLTGGEPTARANIVEIVRGIAHTPGVRSVTMTTNGVLLRQLAQPLKAAGLQRVNISLDTLDPQRFARLTRRGKLDAVWEGIQAAEEAGLTPIKINVVMVQGYNDGQDVIDLARLTLMHPWQVRFIEMMPFGGATDLQQQRLITTAMLQERIQAALGPLQPVNGARLDGEARLYRLRDARGEIGFISSVTQPFCAACTRARLTADGHLRLCLLRDREVDLLTPLRQGADEDALRDLIRQALWQKPWGHRLSEGEIPVQRTMSQIGG